MTHFRPLPCAFSPMIDLAGTGESFGVDNDPAQSARFALAMARHYVGGQDALLLSPLYGDLRGLPPLLIHIGGDEILLSDATRLRDAARRAGVDARLVVWSGMWHGWQLFGPFLFEAAPAVNAIGAFVRERLNLTCL